MRKTDHIICTVGTNGAILFNTLNDAYFTLNESGAFIWSLWREDKTTDEIARAMAVTYGIDFHLAKTDTEELLAELEQEKILHCPEPFAITDSDIEQIACFFARGEKPKLSIVIPSRDRLDLLVPCLLSLASSESAYSEVLIADSGSDSDTFRFYEQVGAHVIRIGGPFNFSKSCNQGAQQAQSELLLFLNSDTRAITSNWEHILLHSQVRGAAGAVLIYPNGTVQQAGVEAITLNEQTSQLPYAYRPQEAQGLPVLLQQIGRGSALSDIAKVRTQRLFAVTGAFLATPKKLFMDLGGLDTAYMADLQDVDYCLKVRQQDLPVVMIKNIVFEHRQSASRGAYTFPQDDWQLFTTRWESQLLKLAQLEQDEAL